jgi:hypothetical protein
MIKKYYSNSIVINFTIQNIVHAECSSASGRGGQHGFQVFQHQNLSTNKK